MIKYIDAPFLCSDGELQTLTGSFTVVKLYRMTEADKRTEYLKKLRKPFQKLTRLRFLNPDNSTFFCIDNNPENPYSDLYVDEGGSLTVNFQNGQRRTAQITVINADEKFIKKINGEWFGQEVALDVGMMLSGGEEYYIPKGIFAISNPEITVAPAEKTVQLNLVDKWANLDGTQRGNLEGTYQVPADTFLFSPISALLKEDRGNGKLIDRISPVYTDYYNNKTQVLSDGTIKKLNYSPYTLTVDGDNQTEADVVLGLNTMINGLVGYDTAGALRIEPSQDDISDEQKPVLWNFSEDEVTLLGATYTVKTEDVFNDYIVVGALLENGSQTAGRAQNFDEASETNIRLIGRKTFRESKPDYSTSQMCEDYAAWKLKRVSVLQNAISVSCGQILHIEENNLITITRTDKEGNPVERHLVLGYTLPLGATGNMTINAVSVNDFPTATLTKFPLTT